MNAKRISVATAVSVVVYIGVGSVLNYTVFPELGPPAEDRPLAGTRIVNEAIHSTFVFRHTGAETNGDYFEWDNFIDKGGGPIEYPHVHDRAEERFRVIDGALRMVVDGREQIVTAGQEAVVPAGAEHAFEAIADGTTYAVSTLAPSLQVDEMYVQMSRAGGLFRVSPVQALVFATRYRHHTRVAGLSFRVQRGLGYLIAPTARLFGVHSYYPPVDDAALETSPR
jgi:mannose-6-phosphate isomerase-like protein (cupin superfamily)